MPAWQFAANSAVKYVGGDEPCFHNRDIRTESAGQRRTPLQGIHRETVDCSARLTGFTVGETGVKSWEKENGQSLDSSSLRDFIWNVGAKGRG
jgi:hypothetical protein